MKGGTRENGTIVDGGTVASDDVAARETSAWAKRRGDTPSPSLVGRTIGSYKITRVLGEGGVGTVYLGEHPIVGSRVAIKVLHDDFADSAPMVDRFVQEARAANAIASRHIVRVSDFGKLDDGRDYAVMEYIEGRSLDAVLAEDAPLAIDRVVCLMAQVAEAMVAAHEAGVVHRDLKPENLFVEKAQDGSEFIRILDFGIAKLIDEGDVNDLNPRQTAAGMILGTPVYCAPEQARGQPVGPPADIYALGAVTYELLTGRQVFAGNVVEILVAKSTRDGAPPLGRTDVPQELEALVMQMLAREPAMRPESMREVLARLEESPGAGKRKGEDARATKKAAAPTLVSAQSPERGILWSMDEIASFGEGSRSGSSSARGSRPEVSSSAPVTILTPSQAGVVPKTFWRAHGVGIAALAVCVLVGVGYWRSRVVPSTSFSASRAVQPVLTVKAEATVPSPSPIAPPNPVPAASAFVAALVSAPAPRASAVPAPDRKKASPSPKVQRPRTDVTPPKGTLVDPFN